MSAPLRITYHRKGTRPRSQLDSIPAGDVKRKALLRRFGSVAGVRAASVGARDSSIGPSAASIRDT